jgi:hypothetical protein
VIAALTTDLEVDLALKDVPILGGAIAGQATHLLTGDEPTLENYGAKQSGA